MNSHFLLLRLGGLMALAVVSAAKADAASSERDPDARAAAVEKQMTDDERLHLIHGIVPAALPGMRPLETPLPEGLIPSSGRVFGVPRLGIPDLAETDASLGIVNPFGLRKGDEATALPSGLSIAASFDPETARRAGALVGAEARAKGFNVLLGGGANLARDWYAGRNFEYLGEDPLLAGTLAGAAITGAQAQGLVSTLKHFSLNAQETLRDTLDARIDEAAHRESDLLAFEIAIEQGAPGAIMCAYNKINGDYGCGNDHLLNKVLKKDWGYKGWVLSDWGAVHSDAYFGAGLDQQSGAQLDEQDWFGSVLRKEYQEGRGDRMRLRDAVRRILRAMFATGADAPLETKPIDSEKHGLIARDIAARGMVLLKNDGALPIGREVKSILVVGGWADKGVLSGWGSSQVTPVGGFAGRIPVGGGFGFEGMSAIGLMPSSPVAALKAALPDALVSYESGYYPEAAAARAKHADLVIVVATKWQSEAMDQTSLALPQGQDALIDQVAAANPNTVVVLETGNPVATPWAPKVRAILEAWYPGQKGGEAMADVLTGKVNPSGRLPMTFPASEDHTPRPAVPGLGLPKGTALAIDYAEGADVGYRWYAIRGEAPAYAFGHGLSYTEFRHSGLKVTGGKQVTARFTIENVGGRTGADVPQLYLVEAAGRKLKRLAGYARVELNPGESREVAVAVDSRLLADWAGDGWRIRPGSYSFALGHSAEELGVPVTVTLGARRLKP